jgi:polar amino acid transport system substrate-binding protein
VIADITHELGRRSDVPTTIMPLATAADVLEAVRSGSADIGFVAPNPERTGIVRYSRRYMLVQQSALVRADSALHSVTELDRPGQVIGINTDDSVGVWLKQRLTTAKVRETSDYKLQDAVQWLVNGDVVAFGGGRQRLLSGTRNVPGLRMLDDNFYGVPQTIAVPPDRPDRLRLIDAALNEFRDSGFLADAVTRSGVEGLSVAPADADNR